MQEENWELMGESMGTQMGNCGLWYLPHMHNTCSWLEDLVSHSPRTI